MRFDKITPSSRIAQRPLFFVLLTTMIAIWVYPCPAVRAGRDDGPIRVPAPLIKWPENSFEYTILVDKSKQKVFVYRRDKPHFPIREYRCSTGENDGQKRRKNDRKTPEGIYFFTKSFIERELSPIYGKRAFPIDYPNLVDKKEGRNGYGIWFHGTNKALKPNDSNGCIVLDNPHIDDLASFIELNATPVVISAGIEMVDSTKQKKTRQDLEKIIESWRRAWETKRIDQYISHYHEAFTSGRKNRQQWKEYKTRLANRYRKIRVDVDNLQLLQNDGVILARFTQTYRTAGVYSFGEKRLYLKQNSKRWKIIGEDFRVLEEKQPAYRQPRPTGKEEIENFLHVWADAWENKSIRTYMSCYARTFQSRGMNLGSWTKHRQKLNRKYRSIKIEISDVQLERVSTHSADVTFKQDYRADDYHDFGIKKIHLIKQGKEWKIRKEEWRPLDR